ncbi:diphthamide biosynthesis protein [Crepidotus variabilis]|uniref:2-(3-amino-3-carboxypropyl)histidine synthase subunit 2 n=1 Tax=Crepidotus variabilis TaxID=179855 RepID=A0A9P6EJ87_9AGAR|nr:diphthamide biosynthesis protein [Crepidotus variabilis]
MSEEPTTSFSTSGEDAVTRVIQVELDASANTLSPKEFDDFFEIEKSAEEILKGDYKRIALQFPDELLHASIPIFQQLKRRIGHGRELYVLADTSYGSCCVDEVAASHVDADAMVHYGHACMSQTSRLPVIYVFQKKPLEVGDCVDNLRKVFEEQNMGSSCTHAILRYDVVYAHQAASIRKRLEEALSNITLLYYEMPFKAEPTSTSTKVSSPPSLDANNATIFYVGAESLGLTNLLITNTSSQVISYDPQANTARLESGQTNRLLMRRYAIVQKARDSDVFGILVGTLGVASYLPLIKHIRALLAKKKKKSYTISVGKLNPAKLANFLEIECFVLVACPENSLIDSKEFLRPIVTPYELELALQSQLNWTGRYVLDFGQILAESENLETSPKQQDGPSTFSTGTNEDDADQPVFSLVTGTYRYTKRYGANRIDTEATSGEDSAAVILRNQDNALLKFGMESAAGQFLQQRSYQGLEVRLGADAPSTLEQGRSGIARGYQDDRTH